MSWVEPPFFIAVNGKRKKAAFPHKTLVEKVGGFLIAMRVRTHRINAARIKNQRFQPLVLSKTRRLPNHLQSLIAVKKTMVRIGHVIAAKKCEIGRGHRSLQLHSLPVHHTRGIVQMQTPQIG